MTIKFVRTAASRTATSVIVAIVTGVVLAGGLAYAAGAELVAANQVNSASIIDNTVASVDIANGTIATADLSAAAMPRFAHLRSASSGPLIVNQRGVAGVSRVGVGINRVQFANSIIGCGLIATLTDTQVNLSALPGQITAERETANNVRVRTFTPAGVLVDRIGGDGFTLMVVC